MTSSALLKRRLGGRVAIGEHICEVISTWNGLLDDCAPEDGKQFDVLFADGQTFELGAVQCRVMWTPGHTPACCSYVMGDAVFVGDTIFMEDQG